MYVNVYMVANVIILMGFRGVSNGIYYSNFRNNYSFYRGKRDYIGQNIHVHGRLKKLLMSRGKITS